MEDLSLFEKEPKEKIMGPRIQKNNAESKSVIKMPTYLVRCIRAWLMICEKENQNILKDKEGNSRKQLQNLIPP